MPDHLGDDMRKVHNPEEKEEKEIKSKIIAKNEQCNDLFQILNDIIVYFFPF